MNDFKCNHCNFQVSNTISKTNEKIELLEKHIMKEHGNFNISGLNCDICDKVFESNQKLIKHLTVTHGAFLNETLARICHICELTFISDKDIMEHMINVHKLEEWP